MSVLRPAGVPILAVALTACAADTAGVPGPVDHREPVALDAAGAGDTYHGLPLGLVDTGAPGVTAVDGRIGVVAIGFSNARQEFDRYVQRYRDHPDVATGVVPVNCARGGNALESWLTKPELWQECRDTIAAAGLRSDQVRVIWSKNANQYTGHGRTLPDAAADYYDIVANVEALVERIERQFPSVQAVYHTSRSYGGYVAPDKQAPRGEPISYEGGHAVNTVLRRWEEQGRPTSAWMGWGPYIWADGATPNGTGMKWLPEDFMDGGTDPHPSSTGRDKVAAALHDHFMGYDWYRR